MSYDLGDYEDVASRLERFHQHYPDGRIVVARPELLHMPDDTWRILVAATVHRTTDDPCPVTDWSAEPYPGRTPYTRGSEVENASTSAMGRALRLALPGRHTASRSEIAARHDPDALTAEQVRNLAGGCSTIGELRHLWAEATTAGVLDDDLRADLEIVAQQLASNVPPSAQDEL